MDTIRTSLVEVSVIVDGRNLPIYTKDARFFVAGEAGKPYRIFVRNLHHARIEILESVDGRNVLKDEAADYANGGMVIRAHSEWDNHGWRINDSETRDFVFGSPSESIAVASVWLTENIDSQRFIVEDRDTLRVKKALEDLIDELERRSYPPDDKDDPDGYSEYAQEQRAFYEDPTAYTGQ